MPTIILEGSNFLEPPTPLGSRVPTLMSGLGMRDLRTQGGGVKLSANTAFRGVLGVKGGVKIASAASLEPIGAKPGN